MPKRRRNNSIANRDAQPGLSDQEMGERLNQRLDEIGEMDVEIPSRSRDTMENVRISFSSGGRTTVRTAGGIYDVDYEHDDCSCPDHRYRGGRCRHLEAVGIARDEVMQGLIPGNLRDENVSSQALSEASEAEQRDEISIIREHDDDNFFYVEYPEEFERDFAAASAAAIPYRYENVLNGSNITFGIELEFVGGDSNAIAQELYDMGLCSNESMANYHSHREEGKWVLERDGSVTSSDGRGGELVSPILTDTPETWHQIETVCAVAKRHGARVDRRTGGHVHIGAESVLDGKRQRWRRFFKQCAGFEEVYRRISGGELGRFRNSHYAASSQHQSRAGIIRSMPANGTTSAFQSIMSALSEGKYQMINISPFATSKKTVEFRGFNGTLTPGIIQANVMYAAGVVNSAERSRKRESVVENVIPTESDRKRSRIIDQYERNNTQTNAAIMAALDTVFARKQDKEHLLAVIAKNSWA